MRAALAHGTPLAAASSNLWQQGCAWSAPAAAQAAYVAAGGLVKAQLRRLRSDEAGPPGQAATGLRQRGQSEVPLPPASAGFVVMRQLQRSEQEIDVRETVKRERAHIFDNEYLRYPIGTGRKMIGRAIRGPQMVDFYMDKHDDPLMRNLEGIERADELAALNDRGFFRRRPQPKGSKSAKDTKGKKKKK